MIGRVAREFLLPRWKGLVVALLCAAAFAALSGLLLRILQPAVNELVVHPNLKALKQIPLAIAALALARGVVQIVQATLVNQIGNGVVGDIQIALFASMVRADLAQLRSSHSGVFVSSVLYDAGLIREAATGGMVSFIQQSLTLLAAAAVMAAADWRLSLLVLLAAPFVILVLRRYSGRAVKAAVGAMESTSRLSTAIMEGLDGVRVVKMENKETYEQARVAQVVRRRQRHILSGDNARAAAAPVSETLMMWVVAAVLAYEGWQAAHGRTDVGAFLAFFASLLTAAQSLRQMSNLVTLMGQGASAAVRLFAALDVEPEVRNAPHTRALSRVDKGVWFEDVSFAYGQETVIDEVCLEAKRGEIVALVGPSGAGKSTILNLIPRFYDVTSGKVRIDEGDIRDFSLASLRSQIGLVTQEPFLFDDTIASNIAYARSGASAEEIEAAARASGAHEFIQALPLGYETGVGESGARLSGGQRQRIAIARAFLKDAPILLLDEPTSALDAESEALIQDALARLMAGRVTLLIAHRLSTVRNADRLYVIDKGRIVETGSHGSLLRREGLYSRLAKAQNLDFLPSVAE
ncbi:MAG: ABC transporter ATP-binding protein [Caulobacteraceae bacterium]